MNHVSRLRRGTSLYSLVLRQTAVLQGIVVGLGLLMPLLAVAPLHLQREIVDEAIPAGDVVMLTYLAAYYAAISVLRAGVKFAIYYLRGWIAEIVERVLRAEVIDAQRRRRPKAAQAALGPVTSILTSEVTPLGGFAAEAVNAPVILIGTLGGVAGYMLATEWSLAVVALAALATEAVATPYLQHQINQLTQLRIQGLRRAGGDVIDAVDPAARKAVVPALGEVRRVYKLCLRMNVLKALLKVIRNLIENFADLALLGVGALMVMRGQTEIGVVVAFMSGIRQIRGPWSELLDFYRLLSDALVKHRLVQAAIVEPKLGPADAAAIRLSA